MEPFVYRGEHTREISFPLGGIGTGCLGLGGDGRFKEWEIFNRPNKGGLNGFSHFAVKAETGDKVLDARVLCGDLAGSYSPPGGMGPARETMAGAPNFQEVVFKGEYPLAALRFQDARFPGEVKMTAFNPFIPLNDKDSSIPGAFFEVQFENQLEEDITYTLALSAANPFRKSVNGYKSNDGFHLLHLQSTELDPNAPGYGDISLATDAEHVSYQEFWYRGSWFDNLGIFWKDLTQSGPFANRSYEEAGEGDMGTLAAHIRLRPGQKGSIRFAITWNVPIFEHYWNAPETCCDGQTCSWKNYYAGVYADSTQSARYALAEWQRLYGETLRFKEALFASTLPVEVLDAVSANISVLKSPTCLRLEDGSFYGFEGCHQAGGCCEGSCTHVWNYAYALPFLFPALERSMRDLDFRHNQRADGKMSFRLQLPLGSDCSDFRACADGQFGGAIKAYRDWRVCGDTDWLKSNWQAIKKCLEFAWAESNEDRWDLNCTGVLEGRQHHTLDMELFGPNAWLTGFYLAALKAAAEIADFLGETETAREYLELFARGKDWADHNLFNGEYYCQKIDLRDQSVLEAYDALNYWNDEAGEIKYQVAAGCGIDQVAAQWHANLCGLGEIFDPTQTRKALASIYRYNFKSTMDHFFNPCRIYSLHDEAGLVICEWPEGTYKPVVPLTYAEETMNGFEYQAAAHMIQEGLIGEGLEVVRAIRERYDGRKRNPWNEFECGNNYARSMASYALLLTFSGFQYHLAENMIGFDPIKADSEAFQCFWSVDSGWGTFHVHGKAVTLRVLYGQLGLKTLRLAFLAGTGIRSVVLEGQDVPVAINEGVFDFDQQIFIQEGQSLVVTTQA